MFPDFSPPLVIGHRGGRARYPENTLAAFAAAAVDGADMIELDVMLTADRQVVVIHDETLERTTDGRGRVVDHRLDEIRALDAGRWFDPRFAGQWVPTLGEVLDAAERPAWINIEIKTEAWETAGPPDAVEMQVMELLRARGLIDTVIVSSFDPRFLERLCRLADAPALAWISRRGIAPPPASLVRELDLYSWHPDHRGLEAPAVATAHGLGLRVFPWTVNRQSEIRRLLEMGVDGIISDDPALLTG